ncbi:MAG TPA: VOC family protein [Gemmatimonadales bacterium]|nr:VOC family protein [Gemmatimonadales bacterium]
MPTKKRPKRKSTPKDRPRPRRQPETLRLRKLTPSFTASDLPRSIAFYRDVLGFVIGEEWRENGELAGCEIHAGAVTFMLGQDDFKKGRDRQKGLGTRVWCHTAQDLDRLAAEIKARGGVLDQEPQDMPWGDRIFMISDPDGFKLSFVQAR